MYRLLFVIALLISLPLSVMGQIVKQGQEFTQVPFVDGKVVFVKEVPAYKEASTKELFKKLKSWGKQRYARDPFVSSIYYDDKNDRFIAKSSVELLLPEDDRGVREKITMRYRMNGFVYQNKFVFEVYEIYFLYNHGSYKKFMSEIVKAENFITDDALAVKDNLQNLRENTRKSTLYFLNELGSDFEKINSY